jgi:oligopeptide/dipeptide ABC transporter ATP-binding protein
MSKHDGNGEILAIQGLKKYFHTRHGVVRAVDGVDLSLRVGETLGLVGESGSGKSTVAYNVIGMYKPTEGKLVYQDQELNPKGRPRLLRQKGEIQIVFQDPGSSLNPRRTIGQSLEFPLRLHGRLSGHRLGERVEELLDMVGLPVDYRHKYPRSIGGGERQLAAVARALACDPSVVVLDEPTSALDVSIQAKVIRRLMELQARLHLAYLFITHDLSLMRNVATKVAIMYLGKVCESAPTGEFFRHPRHPYTRMLLSSVPVISEAEEALKPRKVETRGEIPSPVNVPRGCSFHPRCPECMDVCLVEDPAMREIAPGHRVRCHAVKE